MKPGTVLDQLTQKIDSTELKQRSDDYLLKFIQTQTDIPNRLHDAMQYVVLSGGKRLRALLVYIVGLTLGADISDLDRPAAAIELIHAYSLTHDDLPAMDDDELRRGKPTCHIAYDEATAILAGDALQCLAFEILAEPYPSQLSVEQRLKIIHNLTTASGAQGMAGGQSLDLIATGKALSVEEVERIHNLKTGRLIAASIMSGAICAPKAEKMLPTLEMFAHKIGLAYQIHDDILDIESTTAQLGKAQGADLKQNKATYPSVVGLDEAKNIRDWLTNQSLALLKKLNADTSALENIVAIMVQRSH